MFVRRSSFSDMNPGAIFLHMSPTVVKYSLAQCGGFFKRFFDLSFCVVELVLKKSYSLYISVSVIGSTFSLLVRSVHAVRSLWNLLLISSVGVRYISFEKIYAPKFI